MRWQYKQATIPINKVEATLNALGAERWDLVQIWKEGPVFVGIFKRPA